MSKLVVIIRNLDKAHLIDTLQHKNCKFGAEIGVYNAEFSAPLLRAMPNLVLYMIDPYKHWPDDIYDDVGNDNQEIQDARYELVKKIAEEHRERAKLLRATSVDALACVPDNSLDFVFIDANHEYNFVKEDVGRWYKKVKSGGIVAGHDFSDQFPGVKLAVIEFCGKNNIAYVVNGKIDDFWFFEKEADACKT
jgi:hypothetical protein